MADINSIVAADSYQGRSELGGGTFGVGQIDVRPLENLAAYSYAYKKQRDQEHQKTMEDQAKELANLSSYDLQSAYPDDRKKITKEWNDLYGWVKEQIANGNNVLDFQNNQKGWMEYNSRKSTFENHLGGGKVRSIMYAARQKEALDATTPEMKNYLQSTLDKEASSTDLMTPIKYTNQFDLNPVQVKAADYRAIQVTDVGANMIGTRDYKLIDMDAVANQAIALTSGLMKTNLDKNSDFFKSLTPEAQDLYKQKYEAQNAAGVLEPIKSAENFNEALNTIKGDKKYLNEDGTINEDALATSNNPIIAGIVEQVKIYNAKMDEMINLIDNGAFNDNFGGQLKFGGTNGLSKSSYSKININDGVSPEELLKLRIMAASPANTSTTKITVTKLGLEQQKFNLESWYKHQDIGIKGQELQLKKDRFTQQMKAAKTQEDQDKALNNYYYDNIRQQPNIVQGGSNTGKFTLQIPHANSLPFMTYDPIAKKVGALIPIGGKPIYEDPNATKKIIIGYEGGYYKPEFLINGQSVTNERMVEIYNNYKANDKTWKGSFDTFLKTVSGQTIGDQKFDVHIRGANGTTTNEMNAAGMRIISNSNQKKGQASIWDNTDFQSSDGSTDVSSESSSYSQDQSQQDQNR